MLVWPSSSDTGQSASNRFFPRVDLMYFRLFGHGHLGLTQAATTGQVIKDLIREERPSIDISSYSIARFA